MLQRNIALVQATSTWYCKNLANCDKNTKFGSDVHYIKAIKKVRDTIKAQLCITPPLPGCKKAPPPPPLWAPHRVKNEILQIWPYYISIDEKFCVLSEKYKNHVLKTHRKPPLGHHSHLGSLHPSLPHSLPLSRSEVLLIWQTDRLRFCNTSPSMNNADACYLMMTAHLSVSYLDDCIFHIVYERKHHHYQNCDTGQVSNSILHIMTVNSDELCKWCMNVPKFRWVL